VMNIVSEAGTHFDPKVIDAFQAVEEQFRAVSDASRSEAA